MILELKAISKSQWINKAYQLLLCLQRNNTSTKDTESIAEKSEWLRCNWHAASLWVPTKKLMIRKTEMHQIQKVTDPDEFNSVASENLSEDE